jgi:perosamine synthetase
MSTNSTFQWPPPMPELGDVFKEYVDQGHPLSIAGRAGTVYEELEDEFARLHGRRHALLVSSGTMALYSAYFALGLEPGDEVICTAYSYHATAAPLLHFGVEIVFCDVEPDTGNLNAELLDDLLSSRTRAVVTNDQWGHPVDKDAIVAFCRRHGLAYVEDCSHAHFSEYKGQYSGSFGTVACWSFQGNKLLSGGEGGILLTDDQDVYEKAVLLGHNLKRPFECVASQEYADYRRTGFGLKLRMHPLAAVMVLHQLKNYCFDWIASRTLALEYFQKRLTEQTPLLPMARRDYTTSMGAWYGFKPRLPLEYERQSRQELVRFMQDRGFDVSIPGSRPMPHLALFQHGIPQKKSLAQVEQAVCESCFPGASQYTNSILSIPTFTFPEQHPVIDAYVNALVEFFNTFT